MIMTIWALELKRGRTALLIWTAAISLMIALCIVVYPEISAQMNDVSKLFSDMGGFSAAFGLDRIQFGEFIGFFSVECGNILGLGGTIFASLLGISALSKEEKEKTAEFLLTHPISRKRVVAEKLCALFTQILILNAVVITVTAIAVFIIQEQVPIDTLALLFLSHIIMQLEIAAITFGISAFLRHGSQGIGLGTTITLYFFNIIANLTEQTAFLKYITPFHYTDGGDIIADKALHWEYITIGVIFAVIAVFAAFWKYHKKDIF